MQNANEPKGGSSPKTLFSDPNGGGAGAGVGTDQAAPVASAATPIADQATALAADQSASPAPQATTPSVPQGGGMGAPAASPQAKGGITQAFAPAVGIPGLSPVAENTAGATFNNTQDVQQVESGLDFNKQEKQKVNLPKAGIVQGNLPTPAVVTGAETGSKPEAKETAVGAAPLPAGAAGKSAAVGAGGDGQKSNPLGNIQELLAGLAIPSWVYLAMGGVILIGLVALIWQFLSPSAPPTASIDPPSPPEPEHRIIEYWGLWEPTTTTTKVLNDFEAETGISVNYSKQNVNGYRTRLQDAVHGKNGPDIFKYHISWGTMLDAELDRGGESAFSLAEFRETFYPAAVEHLIVDDQIRGVPLMIDGLQLMFNPTILTAENVNPPRNWGEFQVAARALTQRDAAGKIVRAGAAIGLADNVDHFSDLIGILAEQNGVDLTFAKEDDLENLEKMKVALTFYTDFYNDVNNRVWDEDMPGSLEAFAEGKVAMIFAPTYRLNDLQALNNDFEPRVATIPILSDSADPAWATYWAEGVSSKSNNKEASWQLLAYLTRPAVQQALYAEQKSIGRPIGQIYSRMDLKQSLSNDPLVQPVLYDAPRMMVFPLAAATFDEGINDQLIKYYQSAITGMTIVSRSVSEKTSPEMAAENVAKGTREVLAKFDWPAVKKAK